MADELKNAAPKPTKVVVLNTELQHVFSYIRSIILDGSSKWSRDRYVSVLNDIGLMRYTNDTYYGERFMTDAPLLISQLPEKDQPLATLAWKVLKSRKHRPSDQLTYNGAPLQWFHDAATFARNESFDTLEAITGEVDTPTVDVAGLVEKINKERILLKASRLCAEKTARIDEGAAHLRTKAHAVFMCLIERMVLERLDVQGGPHPSYRIGSYEDAYEANKAAVEAHATQAVVFSDADKLVLDNALRLMAEPRQEPVNLAGTFTVSETSEDRALTGILRTAGVALSEDNDLIATYDVTDDDE